MVFLHSANIRNKKEYKSSGGERVCPGHEGKNSSGGACGESLSDPGGFPGGGGSGFFEPWEAARF